MSAIIFFEMSEKNKEKVKEKKKNQKVCMMARGTLGVQKKKKKKKKNFI